LLPKEKRNPEITTSYGTGELIKAALDAGVRKFIIGIGGSATNDGGMGMAQALGASFLDAYGKELPHGGTALAGLAHIDLSRMDPRLSEAQLLVACDVDNPLCGARGASAVYGPQKGATPELVASLDAALYRYAEVATKVTGRDVAGVPGAGAAGGLGAGFMFFTDAKLEPGIQIVLEAVDFAGKVQAADLVITGEGCTDFQTAFGKAPVGVASIAKKYQVPTICLSGSLGKGYENVFQAGINGAMSIVPRPMSLEQCMENASDLVKAAAANTIRFISIGAGLRRADLPSESTEKGVN
jgi:glycerate kinase